MANNTSECDLPNDLPSHSKDLEDALQNCKCKIKHVGSEKMVYQLTVELFKIEIVMKAISTKENSSVTIYMNPVQRHPAMLYEK